MNPVRQKMASFLTEAVHQEIVALSPESPYIKQLNEIGDVEKIASDEMAKICNEATLGEIIKVSFLLNKLKKVTENEQEIIKNQLNNTAKKLIKRVENKTGLLKLSDICLQMFSQL